MLMRMFICLLLLPLRVETAEVYKCTDSQGRITFSQMPCPAQAQVQVQDIQPINTIGTQPANPADMEYLEDFSKRKAKEREEQRQDREKHRKEWQRQQEKAEAEANAERRHQETVRAIRSLGHRY
jgi:hypothetical protein